MNETKQYCSFLINNLLFGVEVQHVQEVIRHQEMTPIPLAPAEIGGLINLRGQIVTAIDVRQRLGLAPAGEDLLPMNMVVRTDDNTVSLLVDEIGDVIDADSQTFETVPETLSGLTREVVEGVYKLKDRLLLVLDVGKTIQIQ